MHCFTVELNRDLYILRNAGNRQINALASVEPGTPRKHSDHGEAWYCDGLISKAPEIPMTRRRVASR